MAKKNEVAKQEVQKVDDNQYAVKLNHPNPTAVLYYTLDGTYPVPNVAKRYTSPFFVTGRTVVKAVAVVNEDVSAVMTQVYGK